MNYRQMDSNHFFFDVTTGNFRGYHWELCRVEFEPDPEPHTRGFHAVERLGKKRDGETFVEASRRMGVEPTHRIAKLERDRKAEAGMIEVLRNQVRYVTQSEIDFLGGVERFRKIEPHRQIRIVSSPSERRIEI